MKTLFCFIALVFICTGFFGCLKDVKLQKYTYYVPVYASKSEVRANVKSGAPQSISAPGKIYVKDNYIFINEVGKGIHIVDYSIASSPQNVAYIPIPGNLDLSVNGHYLYADEYADLLTIDIADPLNAKLVNVVSNAFPEIYGAPGNNTDIIVSWRRVDTMVKNAEVYRGYCPNCDYSTAANKSNAISTGGSTSRFAVLYDRLYTVSYSKLNILNVENAGNPIFVQSIETNLFNVETIYPFENNLFLGSSIGISIFTINDADNPVFNGSFYHYYSCDPVIAEVNTAYVTLSSGTPCRKFSNQPDINELDVLNTDDVNNPVLIKTYPFNSPRGLAKENHNLFICDGKDGLKILDAADANNISLMKTVPGFEANDVVLNNGIAIVTAKEGLYLIDYNNVKNAYITGKISINR